MILLFFRQKFHFDTDTEFGFMKKVGTIKILESYKTCSGTRMTP